MSDSADMIAAALRLTQAMDVLEAQVEPLLSKISDLEYQLGESQAFTEDRTRLAAALDAAEAKNAQHVQSADDFAAREAEFKRLAAQTTEQLDRIINDVTRVLSKGTIAG